jgi:hypothetical protein
MTNLLDFIIMFRKRTKKAFPPGTFIPTPARVVVILQLCLAFTLLAWNAGLPFMGELFANKAKMFLYQDVRGIANPEKVDVESIQKLQRNAHRFEKLSLQQREHLAQTYAGLQTPSDSTFLFKLKRSIHLLLVELPPFELAWLVFSVVISIMLLKKVEGATLAVWLLPLVVFAYGVDNRLNGKGSGLTEEAKLFPTEETIVADYLKKPLSANVFEQREQLVRGWQLYLVEAWAKQTPSTDPKVFQEQMEAGEFAFNVARLEKMALDNHLSTPPLHKKEPLAILALYLIWNNFFAWFVSAKIQSAPVFPTMTSTNV